MKTLLQFILNKVSDGVSLGLALWFLNKTEYNNH